jgi:hypothetical protein
VLVPFEGEDCPVAAVRRLPLLASSGDPYADNHVAVEVTLRGGERHLLVAMDVEDPLAPSAQFPQAPSRQGARVGRFTVGTAANAANDRGRTYEELAAAGTSWMRH